jgi:hypothetical protein
LSIADLGHAKVIDKVISDVGSIGRLDEQIRKVVVECYVRSLEYSHSKFSWPAEMVEDLQAYQWFP